jgi:hypothetical protein
MSIYKRIRGKQRKVKKIIENNRKNGGLGDKVMEENRFYYQV